MTILWWAVTDISTEYSYDPYLSYGQWNHGAAGNMACLGDLSELKPAPRTSIRRVPLCLLSWKQSSLSLCSVALCTSDIRASRRFSCWGFWNWQLPSWTNRLVFIWMFSGSHGTHSNSSLLSEFRLCSWCQFSHCKWEEIYKAPGSSRLSWVLQSEIIMGQCLQIPELPWVRVPVLGGQSTPHQDGPLRRASVAYTPSKG